MKKIIKNKNRFIISSENLFLIFFINPLTYLIHKLFGLSDKHFPFLTHLLSYTFFFLFYLVYTN